MGVQRLIRSDEHKRLELCLGHEHPVERIAMVERQTWCSFGMGHRDRQLDEARSQQLAHQTFGLREFAEDPLATELPRRHRRVTARRSEGIVVGEPPERDVSVEKQPEGVSASTESSNDWLTSSSEATGSVV